MGKGYKNPEKAKIDRGFFVSIAHIVEFAPGACAIVAFAAFAAFAAGRGARGFFIAIALFHPK
ncbi:MAG: hypothetical protein LBL83_08670 [Clostridiales bacterium]|jgi:hypothetical protein|nr:hypothetical protein [Clostridiales bacterium]